MNKLPIDMRLIKEDRIHIDKTKSFYNIIIKAVSIFSLPPVQVRTNSGGIDIVVREKEGLCG